MPSRRKTVLAIDDDSSITALIERYLTADGYAVITADGAEEGLRKFKEDPERISTVIVDWNMPGMNGIEFINTVKDDESLKYIPIIMLTARTSTEDITAGIKAGAYYYLTKPIEKKILLTLVKSAIDENREITSLRFEVEDALVTAKLLNKAEFRIKTLDEAEKLANWLAQSCPNPVTAQLGLNELFINAIEHGNLGIDFEEKTELLNDGTLHKEINRRLQLPEYRDIYTIVNFERTENCLKFKITDTGKGFDFEKFLVLSPERAFANHGRGIAMVKDISFSHLEYIPPGNIVKAEIETV